MYHHYISLVNTRRPCYRRENARCRCNFPRWRLANILDLIEPEKNSVIRSADDKNHTRTKHEVDRITRCGDMAIRIFRDVVFLNLFANPENPILERNMKLIRWPVEIWPFEIRYHQGFSWDPIFQGRGSRRGSSIVPLKRAVLVSYRLSIGTIALSLTVQPQFAISATLNSRGGGRSYWVKILGRSFWSTLHPWAICRQRTPQDN